MAKGSLESYGDFQRWKDERLPGATPEVISPALYERAKAILIDPERRTRSLPTRAYPLTGRLRCESCGAPTVGQVLMKGRYSYYRCRSRYVGRLSSSCPSKYIPTGSTEGAVKNALMAVLAEPDRIVGEAQRLSDSETSNVRLLEVIAALREIETKQRRLVRLFTDGDLPESLLEGERTELSKKRGAPEDERRRLEVAGRPSVDLTSIHRHLPRVLDQIRQ